MCIYHNTTNGSIYLACDWCLLIIEPSPMYPSLMQMNQGMNDLCSMYTKTTLRQYSVAVEPWSISAAEKKDS